MSRTRVSLRIVALAALASSCSGGADQATDSTIGAVSTSADVASEGPLTRTSTPPTAPVTTVPAITMAPTPKPVISHTALAAPGLADQRAAWYDGINRGNEYVLVGAYGTTPDALALPYVWRSSGVEHTPLPLPFGEFSAAVASSIAIDGEQWAIVGTGFTADQAVPIIWRSNDDGVTIADPETFANGQRLVGESAFAAGRIRAAVTDGREATRRVSIVTIADDGTATEAPLEGKSVDVKGISSIADGIVVIGSEDVDGQRSGRVWVSTDDGESFTVAESNLSEWEETGAIVPGGDGIVTGVSALGDGAPAIATSADGLNWRITPINVEGGEQRSLNSAPVSRVEPFGDGYVVGVRASSGHLAIVDASGNGKLNALPSFAPGAPIDEAPFVLGDQLFSVTSYANTFGVKSVNPANAGVTPVWAPEVPSAASIKGVELFGSGDLVFARSRSYPNLSDEGDDSFDPFPASALFLRQSDSWRPAVDLPTDELTTAGINGDLRVLVGATEDDPDDDPEGEMEGGEVAYLALGSESYDEGTLAARGPGQDLVSDAAAFNDGFLFVGAHITYSESTGFEQSPLLVEYVDGQFVDHTVQIDGSAWLHSVASGPPGTAVAITARYTDGDQKLHVLRLTGERTWAEVELPDAAPDWTSIGMVGTDDGILLFTKEGTTVKQYLIELDGSVTGTEVAFDDPSANSIEGVVVYRGHTLLVGLVANAVTSHIGIWDVTEPSMPTLIELSENPDLPEVELGYSSVRVVGDTLLVAGQRFAQNVVWETNLSELGW